MKNQVKVICFFSIVLSFLLMWSLSFLGNSYVTWRSYLENKGLEAVGYQNNLLDEQSIDKILSFAEEDFILLSTKTNSTFIETRSDAYITNRTLEHFSQNSKQSLLGTKQNSEYYDPYQNFLEIMIGDSLMQTVRIFKNQASIFVENEIWVYSKEGQIVYHNCYLNDLIIN